MNLTKNSTSIDVDVLYPATFQDRHFQTKGETWGGAPRVYNYAVDVFFVIVTLRVTDATTRSNLRAFFKDDPPAVYFSLETFTLTPDAGHDIGNGAGGAITARYWDDDFEEKMKRWQKFPIQMRFRKEN